jgi:YbbR domain-containing protein
VRRVLAFLLRNWPLKLGAIALATVLYGGVVLSENTRTWPGQVPIDVLNPPQDAALLDVPGYVTDIRYRAPLDAATQLTTGSFHAWVDLSQVQPETNGPAITLPVQLAAIDSRVQIVDFSPPSVTLRLDPVVTQTRPVSVDRGLVPEGFHISPPQVDPTSVTITGAASRVASVNTVVARVAIDASGINVDQEVDLKALDENGNEVPNIQIQPSRGRVRIEVARDLATAQLPVMVQLTGEPADGYALTAVSVSPISVTVSGEAPAVSRLTGISTQAIDLSGRDASFNLDVALDPPTETVVAGATTVHVTVSIQEQQASITLQVGIVARGIQPGFQYELGSPSVLVTVLGPAPLINTLTPDQLTASVVLTGLTPGNHLVPIQVEVPDSVSLVTMVPQAMNVHVDQIVQPTGGPSPSPVASPTGSSSGIP